MVVWYDISMEIVIYIHLIALFIVLVSLALSLFLSKDELKKYEDIFGLKKAALVNSSDYDELSKIIKPTRKSAFSFGEPVVWIYEKEGIQLFISANSRKNVRVWTQVNAKLGGIHFVVDSKKNNYSVVSNLIYGKLPSNKLDLEGDFNEYFNLYYDNKQQIQTLQVLAPNIMAFLIDKASNVDVEVIDNQIAIFHKSAAQDKESLQKAIDVTSGLSKIAKSASKVH